MCRVYLGLVLIFFTLASSVSAGININSPKDQLVTLEKIITLKGKGDDLETLWVNDQRLKFDTQGIFSCGLILNYGKNYVEIQADRETKNLKILRLKTYPDVELETKGKKHWARNQITYLATLGLIEEYPDGNFYPNQPIMRGELATWIARAKKLKLPVLKRDTFYDLPKEHWRARYIQAAIDAGYMSGATAKIFGLDDYVARGEAAEIAKLAEGRDILNIPAEGAGENLSRAEAAVLLARFTQTAKRVNQLFDFANDYSYQNFCQINAAPEIVSFRVTPKTIYRNKKATVQLRVYVAPRSGFAPLSSVRINLMELGGLPDVQMYDDGSHGDKLAGDYIYSLDISLTPERSGEKILRAVAVDRLGWKNKKHVSLMVLE